MTATPSTEPIADPGATATPENAPRQPRAFLPALEGMRGMAALGIVVTHVAFQTGTTSAPLVGRLLERFDMAVAVFFALSGFLLWRPHAAAARGVGTRPGVLYYLRHRAARILPAYWVVVFTALVLLPTATAGFQVWAANVALIQVFVPMTLTTGLTQMWSLSVEVAFYAVLPLLAFAFSMLRDSTARARVPAVLLLGLVFLSWNFIPVATPEGTNADNWLPGYLPWFAGGMLLCELVFTPARPARWRRILGNQPLMWAVALFAFLISSTDLGGVAGLTRAEPWQYAAKMALGAIIGFALLAPLVLRDSGKPHRWLESSVAAAIGRWSYGIFIWHLIVLYFVFPAFGLTPFRGDFLPVLVLTVAFTLPIAAASHALVEEPCRLFVRKFDRPKGS